MRRSVLPRALAILCAVICIARIGGEIDHVQVVFLGNRRGVADLRACNVNWIILGQLGFAARPEIVTQLGQAALRS
jgi:hypothetical protein